MVEALCGGMDGCPGSWDVESGLLAWLSPFGVPLVVNETAP
jgi:hypothetical protein